jgi:RNA polymerase sigma-70 factor (ECF subfamily)
VPQALSPVFGVEGNLWTGATDSFTDVITRLRAGDEAAAREIFERFVRKRVRLAHRQFGAVLRRKVDPEDVVQSAYKSSFVRFGEGKVEVYDRRNLWGLLTVITLRKCLDRVEYHRAGCRNVQRDAAASQPWWEAVTRGPTPEEASVLAKTVGQLVRGLAAHEQPVLELSLHGYTTQEIGERLGWAERSLRRLRERIRKRLEGLQLGDAP